MRQKDRLALAERCAVHLRASGADVAIAPRGALGTARYTTVNATWPCGARVVFDIGGTLAPGALLHWCAPRGRSFRPGLGFGSVSTLGHKTTGGLVDVANAPAKMAQVCPLIASGDAWAP